MEFKGRVEEIIDKSGTSKKGEAFVAYQILIEEESGQYPQSGVFDIFGDKVALPKVGDAVTVQFNMKVTKWEGKTYGKNNAWKIEVENPGPVQQQNTAPTEATAGNTAPTSEGSGLPF